MRHSSPSFDFTFSPGPSLEKNFFTPSSSQSSSVFGSHPDVQTPPSSSPGFSSPASPPFGGQDPRRRNFFSDPFAPVAGPSTESNLAFRAPTLRPGSVPDQNINSAITQEPRALPVLTERSAGIFSNRTPENASISFREDTRSTREIPSRQETNLPEEAPRSSTLPADENVEGEDEGEVEVEDENEHEDGQEADEAGDDLFSPDPIDDRRLQDSLNAVKIQLRELSQTIHNCEVAQDPETSLHHIYQEAKKLSEFKDQEKRIVGFIGETGVGKSSVINSILDQRGLARSSGASAACTSVPMEYRYVDEAHPDAYTIEAEFMNEAEVNELLEELLRSIRRAAIPMERSIIAEENWPQYEAIGKMSHETIQAIFRDRPDLTIEYLARGAEDEILQELKQLAMDRLTFRPGGLSSLNYSVVTGDLERCKDELDRLTSDPEDNNEHALWPFIKLIRVFLELPVLKSGLVLADLPGLRDMNYARVRATERYLANTCDEVFIVLGISRCVSNQSIYDIVNKCGASKRIRIVCTRAEETSAEESARGDSQFARRVRKMNVDIRVLEEDSTRIGRQRQNARGHRKAEFAVLESTKEDRIQELLYERKDFIMRERNNSTTRELVRAIHNREEHRDKDIRIFCVSNELYGNHPRRLAEKYRELSGVRELRSYCRSVPAEARMASASSFIENQVPALILSIHQWTLTGRDSVDSARARQLRRVLEKAEADLFQDFMSARGRLAQTQNEVFTTFDTQVMQKLDPYFQRELKEKFVAVSDNWNNSYHWASYAAFCRQNGTHTTKAKGAQCWNDELMAQARPALVHFQVAPQAIGNLLYVLDYRERCIKYIFTAANTHIIQSIESIRDHTLNGHNNSSLIADLMREAYNRCNQEAGTGSDRRRKNIMHDHLSNMQLYRKYAESVQSSYHTAMNEPLSTLREKLHEQVEMIARDLRAVVVPAGEVSEVERAPSLVREFQRRLRRLGEALDRASEAAQAARR
ncbi:hypothetical protein PEBR_33708 [Penicillium brasilianum]|uniref:Uncharacterized protein n=1 Tax=Penicillium brasilianum TaxID=104259 RepID=A0A1S9RG17_PENBI|nr:hypothetical protein PEBR_33708 [Penicillium brasilianum]